MFDTVLIANRGEIACRVIATCRRMGIRTVAVYSDADAESRHVRLADVAVRIGPPPALESYLCIDRILAAARQSEARAIHPGYGFLAENEAFAEACQRAGIVFIGPPAAAIRAMGSKAAAKELMRKAGVPLTPGYEGPNQDADFLAAQAAAIGYPVMIKANAGGGGKGMRRVDDADHFLSALASCRREAASAFGDDSVLLEKYLVQPRHVEVQVFGDRHGNVISLFERDCSVQRRHQKVIEEAPAPLISPEVRKQLSEAARNAARAVGYVGAGTVEFLLDRDGGIHFMEMNTRLQVEHPVTEMITRLDLVEWQLRVAAGEPLPLSQDQVSMHGHAVEARVYAEDPERDFLPSIGELVHLKLPVTSAHVRVDSGVEEGDRITPFYDPMIAKLIVWDESREEAVRRLHAALGEFEIVGVTNNIGFLRNIVSSPSFRNAQLDTSLIEREQKWIAGQHAQPDAKVFAIAALSVVLGEAQAADADSPWSRYDGWRLNATHARNMRFVHGEFEQNISVEYRGNDYRIGVGDVSFIGSGHLGDDGAITAVLDGARHHATVVPVGNTHHVFVDGDHVVFELDDPLDIDAAHHVRASDFRAPMPGRVIAQLVEPGERVAKGDALIVLEAMKMECTIHAPSEGTVRSFLYNAGDQVTEGAELLEFDSIEEKD